MKSWCLIEVGHKIFVKYLDPEAEGALAFLEAEGTSYVVNGCADIMPRAKEVVLEQPTLKLMLFFKYNYPEKRLSVMGV